MAKYVLLLLMIFFICSCVQVPKARKWEPWDRVLKDEIVKVPRNSTFRINIKGQTLPLLGGEELLISKMKKRVGDILTRKGHKVSNNAKFELNIEYKTKVNENPRTITKETGGTFGAYNTNWGILAASSVKTKIAHTIGKYTHTIGVNIILNKTSVFKGDSKWYSGEANILSGFNSSIYGILSHIPHDKEKIVKVEKIKEGKEEAYYEVYCVGINYVSPGLPYSIKFSDKGGKFDFMKIKNKEALDGFVDLVTHVEYALPGNIGVFHNKPTDKEIWSKAIIAGSYFLGKERKVSYLMMELKGKETGYYVSRAWIASDDEYKVFKIKLRDWGNKVNEYFDFYEK